MVHQDSPIGDFLSAQDIPFQFLQVPAIAGQKPSPLRQIAALAQTVPRLVSFLRSEQIDIVHTQDGRMHVTWGAAAAFARVPHIWHQRSPYAPSRLVDAVIRHSSMIIAISKTAHDSLPEANRKKTKIIYNPISLPKHAETPEKARASIIRAAQNCGIKLNNDTVIIASVGNLRDVKQPLLLAETVGHMAGKSHRQILLAVFGEDRESWLPRMREVLTAARGQPALVHFGFRHPIEDWLPGCNLLLATSKGDAFGRALVEAMAVDVPVVAIDAGGHGEIITDGINGLLVPDSDPSKLADAAWWVLTKETFHDRLIVAGRQRAADFNPEKHAKSMMQVYGEIKTT